MEYNNRKYNVNDDYFDTLEDEQYWLIGLLASDGYKGSHNQIGITQSGTNGKILIEYIKNILDSESPIRECKTGKLLAYQLVISSEKITKKLEEFNIVKNKTKTYTLPDIPMKYFNSFLAGYVDGDGCITISDNGLGCNYLCASFVGTQDFIYACSDKIPIQGNIRKHNLSDVYEIRWNGEKAIEFCDWLYSYKNLYHSYKYNNYIKAKENFKNTRKEKYKTIKEKVLNDLIQNKNISITEYAKEIGIPFQTIYKWKSVWEGDGLL